MDPITISALISGGFGFLGNMFGGGPDQQQRKSFEGTGPTDPRNVAFNLLAQLYPMLTATQNRAREGSHLRSAYVPPPPKPVSVPGLPFQIGGGLGTDPALMDPSVLHSPGLDLPHMKMGKPGDPMTAGGRPGPAPMEPQGQMTGLKKRLLSGRQ